MKRFPTLRHKEFDIFKKLNSPVKIQNFVDGLCINFEPTRETCRSPLLVLRRWEAHCMEGAMLSAAALWYNGEKPLLLDLKTTKDDHDHVVALFRRDGLWGAISKTNHAVLRYRDPIYKNVRELAMSYFNEYFLDNGKKTMRSYSAPFSLLTLDSRWLTARENLWQIGADLDDSKHFSVLPKNGASKLRCADQVEIETGKIVQWEK